MHSKIQLTGKLFLGTGLITNMKLMWLPAPSELRGRTLLHL